MTYCDFSSMMLCRFLPRTQPKFRSEHLRHGGPLSSMRHLIWGLSAQHEPSTAGATATRTLCLLHAAQALIFLDICGMG